MSTPRRKETFGPLIPPTPQGLVRFGFIAKSAARPKCLVQLPLIFASLGIGILLGSPRVLAAGSTIHVPADQPTIQGAIDAASNGDTVLVAAGTYFENIDFKGKAITVQSEKGAALTIIDGGAKAPVASFSSGETSASILQGFTLQNGQGGLGGGGITIGGSSPQILNNVVTNNVGCEGAGISISFSSPLVQGNTISNNAQGGCSGGTGGGGINIGGAASAQIINNIITGNQTGSDGGGIALFAAGTPTIRGNTISGNITGATGGGISMFNFSDALIVENLIINNQAFQGGGIAWLVPSGDRGPLLVSNTIAGNLSTQPGSGIFADGFDINTLLVDNIIVGQAGQNAVFCGNSNDTNPPAFHFNDVFSTGVAAYGGICTDQSGQNGNISADPQFVNPASSDYHLSAGSPAIDAGTNSEPNLPPKDLGGNDRILDGNGDCIATVDMGAFEFGRSSLLTLSFFNFAFPDQPVGTSSSSQPATVSNTGSQSVTVCGVTTSGDFSQTNTCGSSLAAGANCQVNLTFSPTVRGVRTGFAQIVTNDAGSPQLITLSGKGLAPVGSLSANVLNFGFLLIGATTPPQPVTYSNTGDLPLAISSISITGDFAQSNNCGTSLAAGQSCTINLTFTPTGTGERDGLLTVTDNAVGSPRQIVLIGNGLDFSLSAPTGNATSMTVFAGQAATYNLQVVSGGFLGAVTLACSGFPATTNCTVTPPSVSLDNTTTPQLFAVNVTTMTRSLLTPPLRIPALPRSLRVPVILLMGLAIAFLWLALLSRKNNMQRSAWLFGTALLLLAVVSAGCSGGQSKPVTGTPAGTYKITITGTASGVHRTLDLTLIVK